MQFLAVSLSLGEWIEYVSGAGGTCPLRTRAWDKGMDHLTSEGEGKREGS